MNSTPEDKLSARNLDIRPILDFDLPWIKKTATEFWGSNRAVSHGVLFDITRLPGFLACWGEVKSGLITYNIQKFECEIVSLLSLEQGVGIGTELINAVKFSPQVINCTRLWVITTNDNTHALRFYQKLGFSIKTIYPGAILESRKLKPEIPLIGNHGIPIKDEIELELIL